MTKQQMTQAVRHATVDIVRNSRPIDADRSTVDTIAELSGVHVGHVRTILRSYGVQGLHSSDIAVTEPVLEALEADLLMPIDAEADRSPTFNVNAGSGSQIMMGHQVTGSQMMAYEVTFQQLVAEIEKAPGIPPEKKQGWLDALNDVATTVTTGAAATALAKVLGLG